MPRRLALLSLLAPALVAAGCGASHQAAPATTTTTTAQRAPAPAPPGYAGRMHAALAPSSNAILKERLELGRVQSTSEGLAVVRRLRARERAVRAKVAGIVPPKSVAAAHRQLLAGFAQLDRRLAALEATGRRGHLAPFLQQAQALAASHVFVTIGGALDAIGAHGYDLGLSKAGS